MFLSLSITKPAADNNPQNVVKPLLKRKEAGGGGGVKIIFCFSCVKTHSKRLYGQSKNSTVSSQKINLL
jgi:hypothetical protein